MIFKIGDI